jgi:hypothetical protein
MRRVHRDIREKDQFMSESFTALVKINNPVAKTTLEAKHTWSL